MKKAFILSLDATIGLLVALILIAASLNYMNKAQKEPLPDVQMERMASDIVAVLNYEGLFSTTGINQIDQRLDAILPPNYYMRLEGTDSLGGVWNTNNPLPQNKMITSGTRIVIIDYGIVGPVLHPGYVRYWIWQE